MSSKESSVHRRKYATVKPESMKCGCGKDATDGYTVEVFGQFRCSKPKGVRLCKECYEQHVRRMSAIYRGSVSSVVTRSYYV